MSVAEPTKSRRPRTRKKELFNQDFPTNQPGEVKTKIDEPVKHSLIETTERLPEDSQRAKLLFNEEPVTIVVQRGTEEHAPLFAESHINGKGIEIWENGRWVERGGVRVGVPVTIKRKYAAVLIGSKSMSVVAGHTDPRKSDGGEVRNTLDRSYQPSFPISLVGGSARDQEWFETLMWSQGLN